MRTPDTSGTTIPAESTLKGQRQEAELSICWVFPDVAGRLESLARPRTLVGRAGGCDLQLPGGQTSRHHAEIVRDGPLYRIGDLESMNGVFLNGDKLPQAPLRDRDIVRLGDWIGIVIAGDRASAWTTPSEIAPGMFGGWPLRSLAELARRAAKNALPVVIEGETGTGKELMARAIHLWSGRSGPFVAVNCAALPDSVAEAELFGYRKGAFTGADRPSLGHFRAAHGGTILLDEIVDMSPLLQAKVLRVLEEREVLPLGESTPVPVDIQVVAAAQSSLRQAVVERRFRGDLLARLSGMTVILPPLRERREEVPFLFLRLLSEHAGGSAPPVEARLVERLCLYDWPFNVRELDLLARRLLALYGHESLLRRAHLPDDLAPVKPSAPSLPSAAGERTLAPRERDRRDLEALLVALRKHNGNVARASAAIQITRQRAYRLMEGRSDVRLEDLREGVPFAHPGARSPSKAESDAS
jgi:two-component system response regulator FlrC